MRASLRHTARRTARVALLLAVVAGATAIVSTQAPAPAPRLNPQDSIPFDQAVHTATLPNGLKYFVRRNARPEKRVALRLAVKAGSLEEADDQQGLAHFLEHMAFNGSTHFKPGALISTFESIGARLGPHVNAYTSFDETVYMLELPTDKPEIVANGLNALADFGGGLTIDPAEVDKERGVVIEEWRGGLGAGTRVRDQQIPLLYLNSRYAQRLPIGKPDVIRTAPAARLRAFYDTWYRPDRMAVVIVGDIDTAQMETAIKNTFGPLKARAPAARLPDGQVPITRQLSVSMVTDPEVTQSSVQIVRKRTKETQGRVADYRRDLVERLMQDMFNERFGELVRKPDARFLGAGVSGGSLGRTVETFAIGARVEDGKIDEGVTAIAVEAKRVRDFGFSDTELERAKKWLAAGYERAYNERDKSESGSFAQEYVSYFLENEPAPGIAYEYQLVKQVLPGITVSETSEMAKRLLGDDSRIVLGVSPQKTGLRIPTDADLTTALASAERTAVTAWSDTAATGTLMEHKPQAGTVAARREIPALGVTVVKFANGVEAWLKPTDFKNDQVLFTLEALGGSSLAPEADYLNAALSDEYVQRSGAGGIKAQDLEKLLAGKIASASPFIALSTHGMSGSAAPADLETALQLAHEQFTAPGDDPEAFALMGRQLEASIANREQSPGRVFGERLSQVNTCDHYTAKPLTSEGIASLDRGKMLGFYRARFANAADFSLFMVGAFKVDEVVPLLAQYVGSLPSAGQNTARFKEVGLCFPKAIERVKVEKGREPRGQTVISFFADPAIDPDEQENVAAATNVLQTALRDILREELGQTYGVSVSLSQPLPQHGYGRMEVSYGSAPENIDAMTERVMKEIKRLQDEGPSADLTMRAKEGAKRAYETNLTQNAYWLRRLSSVHLLEQDPEEILRRPQRIDAVTPELIQGVFRRYFPMDRFTAVTMVPAARQ
ncbi:MAG: insulinase family protein [Acidobacteriota bacterium]